MLSCEDAYFIGGQAVGLQTAYNSDTGFSLLLPSTPGTTLSAMGVHWDNSQRFDGRGDDGRTPLSHFVQAGDINHHLFADDSQLYVHSLPCIVDTHWRIDSGNNTTPAVYGCNA